MCGILAIFGIKGQAHEVRAHARALQKKLRHRGPDWSGTVVFVTRFRSNLNLF